MIEVAFMADYAGRLGSCAVAVGTSALGLLAQADVGTSDPSIRQIGVGTSLVGAAYLVVIAIREGSPPIQKMIETIATARNDRVRLETKLEIVEAQHRDDGVRIAQLESRVAAAEDEARTAKNLLENEKILAEARAAEIETRAREAAHLSRNNAQQISNNRLEIEGIKLAINSGSGDRDPESVL